MGIERDPKVASAVVAGLTAEAQAAVAKAGAAKTSVNVDKKLGHVSTNPGDGEIFWAFGGFDLSVKGKLDVDGSSNRWQFSGSAKIDDTYTFPDTGIRTLFPSYGAAHALQTQHSYNPFNTKLEWPLDAEGSSSSVPGSPRVKYIPK